VIRRLFLNLLALLLPAACLPQEVIYHVFERSFYDANGDRQGDLRGLQQKLSNLSAQSQGTRLDGFAYPDMRQVFGNVAAQVRGGKFVINLPPYGSGIWLTKQHSPK
jgi:hypothetical protein